MILEMFGNRKFLDQIVSELHRKHRRFSDPRLATLKGEEWDIRKAQRTSDFAQFSQMI